MSPALVKAEGVYRAQTHRLEDFVVVEYDPRKTDPDELAEYLSGELGIDARPQ